MPRYPYSYDRWSPRRSPEPYFSRPASPSLHPAEPATYYPSRPRPAEVEDFEGSEIEFAPRVVKPVVKPKKANKVERVQPPPIITASLSPEAPPVFDPSPSSPSVYSFYSSHSFGSLPDRGRPPKRDSFYSLNYSSDRGSTSERVTTPVNASEPLRGILKTGKGKEGKTDFEKSRTRSGSRVRFPAERASSSHKPRRSKDHGGSRALVSEDSMDSVSTTGAECNYNGYDIRPLKTSSRHSRPSCRDSSPRELCYEMPWEHPEYFEYGHSLHMPRQHDYGSHPTPAPAPAPAPADEPYSYYRPSPSPQPPVQLQPQYDPQYEQYKLYKQYEQYNKYEQSPQYTEYPRMEYQPGPALPPQSPIYHPVQPVHPVYMEQPRPRSNSDTYLPPQPIFVDPGRRRSSSGTFLTPAACYSTGPGPYYSPPSPVYPPPNFF